MKRFINDIKKNFSYAVYSAKSQLKSEVASSYLNWVWWILEPLCFMIIYTVMFGVVFNAREQYFPIFIFLGITIWDFFSKDLQSSVKMVKKNKAIVGKVYIPKFILIESKLFVNGFKMLISFGIIIIMMIFYQVPLTWNILYFFPLMITLWIITFGCMCFLLHFGVFIEDLSNVTNIILKFVFYMTGIFYSIESRIGGKYPDIAWALERYNPMAFILSSIRKCVLYGETPSRKFMLIWIIIGLIICALGIRTIYKNENGYVKVI